MKIENIRSLKRLLIASLLCAVVFAVPILAPYIYKYGRFFVPIYFIILSFEFLIILKSEQGEAKDIETYRKIKTYFFFFISLIILGFIIWLGWELFR